MNEIMILRLSEAMESYKIITNHGIAIDMPTMETLDDWESKYYNNMELYKECFGEEL